jgi:phosphoglycolate phosphatase-like HAD superfamily hydrolase
MPTKKTKSTSSGSKKSGVVKAMSAQKNPTLEARARIPQTIGLPGQIANNAGGFSFPLPLEQEWMRYLIIGSKSENGNFYQSGGQISTCISRCILSAVENPATCKHLISDIVDVSVKGRAAKQEMTMLALACVIVFTEDAECKRAGLDAIQQVCRIPTHWFMLLKYIRDLSQDKKKPGKGMGAGVRAAFTKLYTSRTGPELAVLMTKYKNREGWTHKDVISLLHINPSDMHDDGARMVLEWFMKEDKPERKTRTGEVIPASNARTEFLRRLQTIETPALPEPNHQQQTTTATASSSMFSSVAKFFQSTPAATVLPQTQTQTQPQIVKLQIRLLNGDMAGDTITLPLATNAPFSTLSATLASIGAGKYIEFRLTTSTGPFIIPHTETMDALTATKFVDFKTTVIFARETSASLAAAAAADAAPAPVPAPVPATTQQPDEKEKEKIQESPVVAVARFLKALIQLSNDKITPEAALATMNTVRRVQREHLPTHLMSSPAIWTHLLKDMGLTALIRNLGKLSSIGVMASRRQEIVAMLGNEKQIRDSKVHPFAVLVAMKVFSKGAGELGSMTWSVDSYVVTALSNTFIKSFGNIPKTGKRIMVALDVSGSMSGAFCAGSTSVSCRDGSVAMAMATVLAERDENGNLSPNTHVYSFTTTFKNVTGAFSKPGLTLADAIRGTDDVFGGTDCALPMKHATDKRIPIDAFIVYTDSETYAPTIHPQVALEQYRKSMGIDAKLIVVGMASNCLSIADPKDKNTLNLAGFDTSTPTIMSMFINGEL